MSEIQEKPIFITGVYRSGTTLPSQILNNHSKLNITYDSLQFFRFYLNRYDPIDKRYKEIVKDAEKRLEQRFSIKVPKRKIIKKLEKIKDIDYKDVYSKFMTGTFCSGDEKATWGEKSVLEWTNIPTFLKMFPKGKTIHIIRDPRDVLASYKKITIESGKRYLDAVFACLHSMNWSLSEGRKLPSDQYFVLKHEDLVMQPEEKVKQLCKYLKIDYEKNMLKVSKFQNKSGKKRWQGNTAFNDIGKNISQKSIKRWKTKLENYEILFVESIIGEKIFNKFNYEVSNNMINSRELNKIWDSLKETPLLQKRLSKWLNTGEGIEDYPSNPLNPKNWDRKNEKYT